MANTLGARHGRPDRHRARDRRAEGALPGADPVRRRDLVPGLLRAAVGLRPRLAEDARGARRTAASASPGQKVWTTLGAPVPSGACSSRARTPTRPKHRGLTYFLMDMEQDGVEVRPLRQITGEAEFNELFIEDAFDPGRERRRRGRQRLVGGHHHAHARARRARLRAPGRRPDRAARARRAGARARGGSTTRGIRDRLAQLHIEAQVLRLNAYRGLTGAMKRGAPGPGGLAGQVALGRGQPGADRARDRRPAAPRRSSSTTRGPTASCARGPTRSRAGRPRSSRTSSPSACSGCRADELRPLRRPAATSSAPRASSSPRATRWEEVRRLALEEERGVHRRAVGGDGRARLARAAGDLGMVELAVLAEELGYALAPTPLQSHLGGGAAARRRRGGGAPGRRPARRRRPVGAGRCGRPTRPRWRSSDGRLSGVKLAVPDAAAADVLVVTAAGGRHVVVEAGAPGWRSTPPRRSTPRAGCPRCASTARRPRSCAATAGEAAWLAIAVASAAESVGVAQRAMEMAVAYAKERKQFGRPIGTYQAVSHACAQMLLEVEGARAATLLGGLGARPRARDGARWPPSMAKAYASDAGRRVTQRRAPGPRRHRLHLGARPALPAQARAGERAHVRRRRVAPRRRVAALSF